MSEQLEILICYCRRYYTSVCTMGKHAIFWSISLLFLEAMNRRAREQRGGYPSQEVSRILLFCICCLGIVYRNIPLFREVGVLFYCQYYCCNSIDICFQFEHDFCFLFFRDIHLGCLFKLSIQMIAGTNIILILMFVPSFCPSTILF